MIKHLEKVLKDDPEFNNGDLEELLLDYKVKYNLTNEFLIYTALCGVFSPRRNIVKYWDTNEELFLSLIKLDGKLGLDHFFQSVVLYFIRLYKTEAGRFGPTFMKKMIDNNTISEKFILDWYNKEISLDKDSMLRDKNAEKKFRNLLVDFLEWLATAETELGEAVSPSIADNDGEDDDEDQIKEKGGKPAETEK